MARYLWEYWIDGFSDAVALRPDAWDAAAADADGPIHGTPAGADRIARDESELDSVEVNPSRIVRWPS